MDRCQYLRVRQAGDETYGFCELNETMHPEESELCKNCDESKEAILE